MQKERGTDASNINDEEAENKEFSDDEEEREFKQRTKRMLGKDKRKRVGSEGGERSSGSSPAMKPRICGTSEWPMILVSTKKPSSGT